MSVVCSKIQTPKKIKIYVYILVDSELFIHFIDSY